MAPSDVPWLGQRLREERVRQGITVRGLAREVGVSASMISQIETAKSQPSVSTLYAITSALRLPIEDLFTPPVDLTQALPLAAPVSPAPAPATTTVLDALQSMRGGRLGPLVHPDDRRVLALDSGVTWELLGELPHRSVSFVRVTYAPGGASSSAGALMRHPGSEYGFLHSGRLVLTLGFDQIEVGAGDAISFDSTIPHAYRNDGDEPAIGVWFVVEREH
jgi:transcriptional regulator with XRE-family HTH domain